MDLNVDIKTIAKKAIKDEQLLSELLESILSKKDEIRFNSHKILIHISKEYPQILYSKWEFFADMLDSDNHYHRYIALNLLANLAQVDTNNKSEKIIDRYFSNIDGDRTMVAGHAALNIGKIAKAKPHLQTRITQKLLNCEKTHRGKHTDLMNAYVIEAFNEYFQEASDKKKIIDYVKAQVESKSPKTRKAAQEFLTKWNKQI